MKKDKLLRGLHFLLAKIFLTSVVLIINTTPSQASIIFSDNFENGFGNWIPSGSWGLTKDFYISPTHAATDSPGTFYTNNTDSSLTLARSINLSSAVRPALRFYHKYALETDYDFLLVEVSTNGGSSWVKSPLATYSGSLSSMTFEQLDLSPYAGVSNLSIRFRLLTDSSVIMDGWYVDDILIAETPAPVTLKATETNCNSISLSWTQSVEPNFAAYRLYRSLSPGVDWHTATLVAEINDAAITNITDITASPKTKYFYRLAVVNSEGLLTLGNEIVVTTHPGIDYPFVDNGEGGPNTWVADAPWTLSNEQAASPTHAWSDSPGTNYANSVPSQSLTLAAPLFLSNQAVSPVLSFYHKYDFAPGDSANVEISTNTGISWQTLATYTGTSTNEWNCARIDLKPYKNNTVLIRFRITTDSSGNADGWHIDNISVAESPAVVPAPVLDQITSHSIRISWSSTSDPMFAAYAVFRSTKPGVSINSTLVALITDPTTTTFTDANLSLDTMYYYRVYVVNAYGTFSPDSPTESSARTLNNPLPFTDDFEGTLTSWNLTGTWGRQTNDVHSGFACLSDSPGASYTNNSDSFAQTAVNLAGSTWPVLRFWDRYRMANGGARVEVSTDGNNWSPVYGPYGIRELWQEQIIDLSPWKNQNNLRIRFHLWSDSGTTDDGWSIDDLQVVEHTPVTINLPFVDSFENGLTNWLHSSWNLDTNAPYEGNFAIRDVPGRMTPDTTYFLTLAGTLNLSNTINPQLVFWVKGQLSYRSRFRVQYSTDGGLGWADLTGWNYDWNSDWTRVQVSLQNLTNQTIRLRFVTWNEWGSAPSQSLWLDKIVIEDMPPAVTLLTPEPGLRSVSLSWTPTTLGQNFKRYEVYRSTSPNLTWTATLIGTFNNPAVTNITDSGLSIGATYYYQVFTVDKNDVYIPSNERSATTVPVLLPMTDSFDTTDQWVTTGSWNIGPDGHNDTCLTDSPNKDYDNNADSYALTAVNLAGSTWPVLRFWDRYRMANGDWARVEVSTDGNNWSPVYGPYGIRELWQEQIIDLSPWKNQNNLRIRFHLWSDSGTTDDGWSIDDLQVVEHTPVTINLPFVDSFENGLTNWLHSSWNLDTNAPYEGNFAIRDVPGRMTPDTTYFLTLAGTLNLSNTINPQLVFWVKGQLSYRSRFRVQYSTDGGLGWADLTGWNYDWNSDWTRVQVSLQNLTNQTIRLRFVTWNEWGSAPSQSLWLDKIVIEEPPPPVVLDPPSDITPNSIRLTWSETTITNFKEYRVYRSESPNVSESSVVLAVITNRASTTFTDTGLMARKTYYYRVYLYNQNDTGIGSNLGTAMTTGVPLPFEDGFETNQPGWTFTGTWTIWPGVGRNGSAALVDSPADYPNNSSHFAQFAVDLRGLNWPVLRFWDRHAIANDDWGRVFISGDGGNSWTCVYGVSDTRTNWLEQMIDLSPWKNSGQVWIRFQMTTDSVTQNDGWYIDDVSVEDYTPPPAMYPMFENFENGLNNWLHSSWMVDTNTPYAGLYSVRDTVAPRIPPDTQLSLVFAREIDLRDAVNPSLTFWVRGQLWYRTRFRAQVSTNAGVNWNDLIALNHDWNQGWTRMHVSLNNYTNCIIRLRFIVWSEWGSAPDQDLFLDNIGIGEPEPSAPTLASPANLSSVPMTRPTLSVTNAIDLQGDPLTYRFEVYSDATLSNIVAQVPVVASGWTTTTWQVDIDLPNNHQYWWRCQATDGTNVGPWMLTATFFVNETNHPPFPPVIAGPPLGSVITNLNALLMWFPSPGDPDEGDRVATYHIQVASDPSFKTLVMNVTNIIAVETPPGSNWVFTLPIASLPGAENLIWQTLYYWRISAQDLHGLSSVWSEPAQLQYGTQITPEPTRITAIRIRPDGQYTLEWTGKTGSVFLEFSETLSPAQWQTIAGPLSGTNWTLTPVQGKSKGFYRIRIE